MKQKVKVLQDFPETDLVRRKLGPFREGEEVSVRVWEATLLEERGIVEPVDDFSVAGLRKLLIKEEKSSTLEELPDHFYQIVFHRIGKLGQERAEEADEMRETVNSLLNLRIQKLAKMTISSAKPDNVLPEEKLLVNRLSQALESWRDRLDYLCEKNRKEEVGAHRGRIGRSIQRIVRNPANIQE